MPKVLLELVLLALLVAAVALVWWLATLVW